MKRALIVGMAKSGIGAAKLLCRNGYHVIVNDMKTEIAGLTEALKGYPVEYKLGVAPDTLLDDIDLLIPSPVIPLTKPFVVQAKERGIEVISEIELGFRYSNAEFVCISGTNGKTTCTALTGEMFKAAYKGGKTWVLGNIGVAITEHAEDTRKGDIVVAETAALQMEGNVDFHARAGGMCNITEDHLDHFGTMENYIANKEKLFLNQTENDFAVLNWDDHVVRSMARLTPATKLFFSRREQVPEGMWLSGNDIIYRRNGRDILFIGKDEIRIPGGHNLENAMLSSLLALSMGLDLESIKETLRSFPGVEHRIEFVRELDGVVYINDSKGTNPASTIRAIEAMTRPTVLILGGYDKHNSFDELFAFLGDKIKAIVVLGQTKPIIIETGNRMGFGSILHEADSFREAIDLSRKLAKSGDAVLLSPACASWDMFDNFEQRGEIFKNIVNAYQGE